ncbi:MAG: L,D-transpeptidase family protein [Crocinitomicaceae bacterium]|nr:L,D-transpeptidase family protein [Crocinitomicaceae bacterium]
MKSLLTLCILLLVISACSEAEKSKEEIQSFELQNIPVDKKIKKALSADYLKSIGLDKSALSYLTSYYKKRNYQPRWIDKSALTVEGEKLKKALQETFVLGIPRDRIKYGTTKNFIQDELWLTATSSKIINDLQNGIIDYEGKKKKKVDFVSADQLDDLFNFNDSIDIRQQFMKFGPIDTNYMVICRGLIEFTDTYPMDTSTFEVQSIRYDSMAIEKAQIALVSKGYLKEGIKDSLGVTNALKVFQEHNGLKPDGVIGKYTSQALNESTVRKVERAILALDKIRSQRIYPEKYIRINIPEYKLRLIVNHIVKSDHNIVVGKYANQTPELESKLRKIVVYPYWNVPYSISSKEILPALKRDPGYLALHDYKLLKKGEEVDPLTVDWKKVRQNAFPYRVQQQPGPRNSLGIIKFDFYNEHSVYFHDTPSKGLFSADVRAYSHGCMRTQHPVDLAKAILDLDSIPYRRNVVISDTLDSLLARNTNIEVRLIETVPIYIDYVTVARVNQRMVTYLDIYGRDEEYLKIMRE